MEANAQAHVDEDGHRPPEQRAFIDRVQVQLRNNLISHPQPDVSNCFHLNTPTFTGLTIQPTTFRESFLTQLAWCPNVDKSSTFCLEFASLTEEEQRELVNANLLPTDEEYETCATDIAESWRMMPLLETVTVESSPSMLSFAMLICSGLALSPIKKLTITRPWVDRTINMPILTNENRHDVEACIAQFPLLEHLYLEFAAPETFQALGSTLLQCPNLKTCTLVMSEPLVISSSADANVLRCLLESPTLSDLSVYPLVIDTVEAGDIVGAAIMASRIEYIRLGSLTLENKDKRAATAVAESTKIDLRFDYPDDIFFWERLCPFFEQIKLIRYLTVTFELSGRNSEVTAVILHKSRCWTVRELYLYLASWNARIEWGLAGHARDNKALQTLSLQASSALSGSLIQSEELLQAIDSAQSSVMRVYFSKDNRRHQQVFEPVWRQRVLYIADLNAKRSVVRYILARPSYRYRFACDEVRVLSRVLSPSVDWVTLFEFMRRNEWNLLLNLLAAVPNVGIGGVSEMEADDTVGQRGPENTMQRRRQDVLKRLQRRIYASLSLTGECFGFDSNFFVGITVQAPSDRTRFLRALAAPVLDRCREIRVRVTNPYDLRTEFRDRRSLDSANAWISSQEYQTCAAEIAMSWRLMPQVKTIKLETDSVMLQFAAAMLTCQFPVFSGVKNFTTEMTWWDRSPMLTNENIGCLEECLAQFPLLESVRLEHSAPETFQALGSTLLSFSNLKAIALIMSQPLLISSVTEATVLQRLLESSALTNLSVYPLMIDAIEASDIVSAAIMASHIKEIRLGSLTVENMVDGADLATIKLAPDCSVDRFVWERLIPMFSRRRKLRLQMTVSSDEFDETMPVILNASRYCSELDLSVTLNKWDAQIESKLVRHVSMNKSLRKLSLDVRRNLDGSPIKSDSLLEAIDTKDSSLVEISFRDLRSGQDQPAIFDLEWRDHVEFIVSLNLHRSIVRSQLAHPSAEDESVRVLRMLRATTVSGKVFHEFLRRNEWNLQRALPENHPLWDQIRDEMSE